MSTKWATKKLKKNNVEKVGPKKLKNKNVDKECVYIAIYIYIRTMHLGGYRQRWALRVVSVAGATPSMTGASLRASLRASRPREETLQRRKQIPKSKAQHHEALKASEDRQSSVERVLPSRCGEHSRSLGSASSFQW